MKVGFLFGLISLLMACDEPSSTTSSPTSTEIRRRQDVVMGSELSSDYQGVNKVGGYLSYQGPVQDNCLSIGSGVSQYGQDIKLEGSIELEARFVPEVYDTCSKRDWKNKCIGWDTHFRHHELTLDMIGSANGRPFHRVIPITNPPKQKFEHSTFVFDALDFAGPTQVEKVEIRVCNIVSREIDITVRKIKFDWVWGDTCNDPYVCTSAEDVYRFISETQASIEPATRAAVVAHAKYLRMQTASNDLGCLIESVDDALIYPEVSAQLKENFQQQFAKPFVKGQAICDGSLPKTHLMSEMCSPEISSQTCDLYDVYTLNRNLLWEKWRLIYRYRTSRSLNPEIDNELTSLSRSIHAALKLVE